MSTDLADLCCRPGLLVVQEQVRDALLPPGMSREEWQQLRDMAAQMRSADARTLTCEACSIS